MWRASSDPARHLPSASARFLQSSRRIDLLRRTIGCAQHLFPFSILDVGRIPPPRRQPARAGPPPARARRPASRPRQPTARRGRSRNVPSEERNPQLRARNFPADAPLSSGASRETNKTPLFGLTGQPAPDSVDCGGVSRTPPQRTEPPGRRSRPCPFPTTTCGNRDLTLARREGARQRRLARAL